MNKQGAIMVIVAICLQLIMISSLFVMHHMILHEQAFHDQLAQEKLHFLTEGLLNYGILVAQEGHAQLKDIKNETTIVLRIPSLPGQHEELHAQLEIQSSSRVDTISIALLIKNRCIQKGSCILTFAQELKRYEVKEWNIS